MAVPARTILRFCTAVACMSICACNGQIYPQGRQTFPDAITPQARWTAVGNLQEPSNAIDGNIATVALGPLAQANNWIAIDLGKSCMVRMVILEHGMDEFGYCRELSVQTSDDGQNWSRGTVVPGLRRVTNCLLTGPVLARYVRLHCLTPGARPWSVAEVYID